MYMGIRGTREEDSWEGRDRLSHNLAVSMCKIVENHRRGATTRLKFGSRQPSTQTIWYFSRTHDKNVDWDHQVQCDCTYCPLMARIGGRDVPEFCTCMYIWIRGTLGRDNGEGRGAWGEGVDMDSESIVRTPMILDESSDDHTNHNPILRQVP